MADKHIAVSCCAHCPASWRDDEGDCCSMPVGLVTRLDPDRLLEAPPTDCPLRQGRVILFLNEKREG